MINFIKNLFKPEEIVAEKNLKSGEILKPLPVIIINNREYELPRFTLYAIDTLINDISEKIVNIKRTHEIVKFYKNDYSTERIYITKSTYNKIVKIIDNYNIQVSK